MRRKAEYFGETELTLLYMASRLNEALRLEELLTAAGTEYLVETGTYVGGLLMKRELTGAFFYVHPSAIDDARIVLTSHGYKPYVE